MHKLRSNGRGGSDIDDIWPDILVLEDLLSFQCLVDAGNVANLDGKIDSYPEQS